MKKVLFVFLAVSITFVFVCCAPTESDTQYESTTVTETAPDISDYIEGLTSESKFDFPEIDLSKIETNKDKTETNAPVNTDSSKVDESFVGEEGELTPDDDNFGG